MALIQRYHNDKVHLIPWEIKCRTCFNVETICSHVHKAVIFSNYQFVIIVEIFGEQISHRTLREENPPGLHMHH